MKTRKHEQRATAGTASPPHPTLEITYAAVVESQQWSPSDLSPAFDVDAFVSASYAAVAGNMSEPA